LRTIKDSKPINLTEIDADVIFGEIHKNTLNQLNKMIDCVFSRYIEEYETWGDCDGEQVNEFKELTTKFSRELTEGLNNLQTNQQRCVLKERDFANDVDRNNYYEKQFTIWIDMFRKEIENDNEGQSSKASSNQDGPKTELKFWR
jgi:hypothetical protein